MSPPSDIDAVSICGIPVATLQTWKASGLDRTITWKPQNEKIGRAWEPRDSRGPRGMTSFSSWLFTYWVYVCGGDEYTFVMFLCCFKPEMRRSAELQACDLLKYLVLQLHREAAVRILKQKGTAVFQQNSLTKRDTGQTCEPVWV